jgi:hypothetical protein
MASHAHHRGDPISAAKIGGIAVALITTVGGIIVAVVNQIGSVDIAKVDTAKEMTASVPAYGSCVGATSASALKFTFQGTEPTTPPPPPPDQILDCAKQHGPSCFNGPGFGPPTTYPNQ